MERLADILNSPKATKPVSENPSVEEEPKCTICRGAGFVHPLREEGKPDYSQVVPCACSKERLAQEKLRSFIRNCELPVDTEHMTFENFEVFEGLKEAYDAALTLANEEQTADTRWLTLTGGWDRGKTHLAVAICRRWLQRGKPARYAYVPLLLDELRRGFQVEGESSYQARFEFFCKVPLLVLDDLGVEKTTNWAQEKLDTIVHYRGINGLPLVITTNLVVTDLPGRIASRVQREHFCRVIGIETPEYRLVR